MPIFGADPDKPTNEWEEMPSKSTFASKPVRDLTNYFAYHRHMGMSQRCNDDDKIMLNIFFPRRLKQGFSSESLRQVVDRFYQTPAGSHDYPAYLFCKHDVQEELIGDIEVNKDDPILQWFLDGMPTDDDIFDHPREMRKAVLIHCEDSLLRYPELVAAILRLDRREPENSLMLASLEELVMWNLGNNDEDVRAMRGALADIRLPRELRSSVRSPKSVRKRHDTVQQAIIAIPVRRKEEW